MATPQLSPGVLTREVDLTVGRAENVLDNIGAIAGPFSIGPVDEPVNISTENDLLSIFGKPSSKNNQYEYWMSASSYLSYGGILKVVRVDDGSLVNSNAAVNSEFVSNLKIKNFENYNTEYSLDEDSNFYFVSKNPGTWANNLKVCMIDNAADQTIGVALTNLTGIGLTIGCAVTSDLTNVQIPGSSQTFTGYLKGIVTNVTDNPSGNSSFNVKIVSRVSSTNEEIPVEYNENDGSSSFLENYILKFRNINGQLIGQNGLVGAVLTVNSNGTSIPEESDEIYVLTSSDITGGSGTGFSATITRDSNGDIDSVTITNSGSNYASGNVLTIPGTEVGGVSPTDDITLTVTGVSVITTPEVETVSDWYNQQTLLELENANIYWRSIAEKPTTNEYVLNRNGLNDAIHIVLVDDDGSISGIQGNILEKHLNLSKSKDAISSINYPIKLWYKDFLANYSNYVYAGTTPSTSQDTFHKTAPLPSGFSSGFIPLAVGDGLWGLNSQNVKFSSIGNKTYKLKGGADYQIGTASLTSLINAYDLFANKEETEVDYLIYGPSLNNINESQIKASHLITIANNRKDCIAVISPHKDNVVNQTNTTTQTNAIINFFTPMSSSSYAVFDSGYKYTYDRFNNRFVYIPCNADVAGLMARTNVTAYPWFSPAGQQRGVLNNAIKLAYNPNKDQRDLLYQRRINSIINQPGAGIILFGDKTALSYASAFDRINVRRLFLTVEQSLQRAANAQLFEFNDQLTRSNFVNIVEPYLRDVQAKRGLFDFRVICDESNNTPDVIDNNEFRADIFLKPARSINYITLTFVATRTGVSFEEVAGNV